MKKLAWILMMTALAASLALWGCSSSDDGDDNPVGPGPVANVGSISGLVNSASKAPLDGVTVTAGGETTVTNQDGYFVLAQVPEGPQIVAVIQDGWMSTFRHVTVLEGQTTHLPDLTLVPAQTAVVDGTTGGTAATGDGVGSVEFGAGAFETGSGAAYDGQVTVEMTAALPGGTGSEDDFYGQFPGDFEGEREDGTTTMFESFGFMTVNLYGADKSPLQLADGETAGLSLDIGAEKAAVAPATIPMWYFDESDGLWHEEGEATLVGTSYEADVAHFTTWNWDLPVDEICRVEGYVFDVDDNPVVDARVISSGVDYAIRDEDYTDANGFFSVRVRMNSEVDIYAMKGSRISEIQRGNIGSECPFTWPIALVLTVPTYSISLTWGATPSDLDSHLYIPMPWDDGGTPDYDWYHLYYSTDGTLTQPPYAELDYDDTSSYGPENITGTRLWPGHYEYWVDNFSTDTTDDLWASDARVRLEIAGGTWIFDVADIDQPPADVYGWWHVFDFDVNASGTVTVDPIENFATEWIDDGIGYDKNTVLTTK